MIWNLFGGKSGPTLEEDRIWQSGPVRLAAVCREALAADAVLVVAHFRSTLAALQRLLDSQGQPCRVHADRIAGAALTRAGALARSGGVALALAEALPVGRGAPAARAPEALVIVAERHFVPARDEHILEFCRALPTPSRLRFHESLDAPLLQAFGGKDLRKTLLQLGASPHECIEHGMATRAIRSAQEKFAAARTGDRPADSPQDWIRLNQPPD